MKRIIGVLMLAAGAYFGYSAWNIYEKATAKLDLGPIELKTSKSEETTNAYIMGGLSGLLVLGGIYLIAKK